MKFYKVDLYQKPDQKIKYKNLEEEIIVGKIIVKEKLNKAQEVITGLSFDIYDLSSTIKQDPKTVKKFGRDLYIKDSDINENNIATAEDINTYLNSKTNLSWLENEQQVQKKKVK